MWRAGGTFQEWSEHFALDRWLDAMAAEGLDPDWYVTRHRTDDEILPWDHIAAGLHRDFLWQDWQAALAEHGLPDCRWTPCYDCGVCTDYALEHVVASRGAAGRAAARAPARTSASAARCPVVAPARPRAGVDEGRRAGSRCGSRFTKRGQGAVHLAPRRRPRASSARSASSSSRSRSPRASRPGPKVSFGLALSVGHESDAEYLDVELREADRHSSRSRAALTPALPEGIDVAAVARARRPRARAAGSGRPRSSGSSR